MPIITASNPPGVREPASRYSHTILIENESRRVVLSGQVGMDLDGSIPNNAEAQVALVFRNLRALLKAHGMGIENVVKTTAFLTDRSVLPAYRAAREAVFAEHAPASTLLFVAGLADPRFLVEVEAEAVG
ncbi:MAG TPA: RidA family protein [Acetobacteraceae bacterium]|nr:RidA family protein [Acetobacteraceae bacterium]